MTLLLTLLAIFAPGSQCEAVADTWDPAWRGGILTRGCDDLDLGA